MRPRHFLHVLDAKEPHRYTLPYAGRLPSPSGSSFALPHTLQRRSAQNSFALLPLTRHGSKRAAYSAAFVISLDCCDRQGMSYAATTGDITGELVRDLMAHVIEHRFGPEAQQTPHRIEWLSDDAPCYTAHQTRASARRRASSSATRRHPRPIATEWPNAS